MPHLSMFRKAQGGHPSQANLPSGGGPRCAVPMDRGGGVLTAARGRGRALLYSLEFFPSLGLHVVSVCLGPWCSAGQLGLKLRLTPQRTPSSPLAGLAGFSAVLRHLGWAGSLRGLPFGDMHPASFGAIVSLAGSCLMFCSGATHSAVVSHCQLNFLSAAVFHCQFWCYSQHEYSSYSRQWRSSEQAR